MEIALQKIDKNHLCAIKRQAAVDVALEWDMLNSRPRLITLRSPVSLALPLKNGTEVKQATFSFYACGVFPMQHLRFTFLRPDGTVLCELQPRRLAPRDQPVRTFRRYALVMLAEYLARLLMRRPVLYFFDVAPEMLAHSDLSVRIDNTGASPLVLGHFRLNTSTLARERTITNTHSIEGYSDKQSVVAGEVLNLYVHAPLRLFSITVIRHGATADPLFSCNGISGIAQDYSADAYEKGAGWALSYALAINPAWKSGLYTARLGDAGGLSFDITFIVKAAVTDTAASLAVLASTNTWQAYNAWGGASAYRYDIKDGLEKTYAFIVHALRPNPAAALDGDTGHLANAEKHLLAWLDQNNQSYHLFCDRDLHDSPDLLTQFGTLIINTHSEYWTREMYEGVERFLDRGGNLVYLSGNGLFWKMVIRGDQYESRVDHSRHTLVDEAGGRWRDFGRPETRVTGIRFTRAGYKSPASPYKVISPSHWVFEGTGLKRGDLIGAAGLNCGGASGWELDKIDPESRPASLVHLAKGTNRRWSGADMTCFTHPGGGSVFSVGSVTFGGSLAVDPVLSHILRNVLHRFAGGHARP